MATETRHETISPRGARWRTAGGSAALIGLATLVANGCGYALLLVLNRTLTSDALGATAALLNLTIIAGVLALALQLVAARHFARDRDIPVQASVAQALATGIKLGLAATALVIVSAPLLSRILDVDGLMPLLLVALTVTPTYVLFALQGCLHGHERFAALGLVYVIVAGGRFAAGAGAALAGAGVLGVLGTICLASWVSAAICLALVPGHGRGLRNAWRATWVRDVARGAMATSALLVVTSLDLPLARALLSPDESGEYAVVALFAKAAYWGPAFLATLFFPRMARSRGRRTVLQATGATVLMGVAAIAIAAVWADVLVRIAGGPGYTHLSGLVPLLTAAGSAWSVAQVLVYWRLARGDHRLGYAVWVAAAAVTLVIVLWRHDSPAEIASTMAVGGISVMAYGLLLVAWSRPSARRRARSGPGPH